MQSIRTFRRQTGQMLEKTTPSGPCYPASKDRGVIRRHPAIPITREEDAMMVETPISLRHAGSTQKLFHIIDVLRLHMSVRHLKHA